MLRWQGCRDYFSGARRAVNFAPFRPRPIPHQCKPILFGKWTFSCRFGCFMFAGGEYYLLPRTKLPYFSAGIIIQRNGFLNPTNFRLSLPHAAEVKKVFLQITFKHIYLFIHFIWRREIDGSHLHIVDWRRNCKRYKFHATGTWLHPAFLNLRSHFQYLMDVR